MKFAKCIYIGLCCQDHSLQALDGKKSRYFLNSAQTSYAWFDLTHLKSYAWCSLSNKFIVFSTQDIYCGCHFLLCHLDVGFLSSLCYCSSPFCLYLFSVLLYFLVLVSFYSFYSVGIALGCYQSLEEHDPF